ncbi:uncharacterized protein BP5553_05180 [Venustampulla echinocandica]|uniref:Transmembrane protein n=1 Tax=Venustampulla echinocandica TaxID=2656787 RepID=A0A370TQE7_9HELO|nr:uncharacterized protein BP5553_05180 [Venustampulla echinocandica]RDL37747.1 hypothetical protein BP5553_05180 [Venustampulla echinocandica]
MFVPLLAIIALQYQIVTATEVSVTVPPEALVTPGPKLYNRASLSLGDPRFLGWQVDGGTVYQRTCASGYTYSVSSPYFACCNTAATTCSFVNNCNGFYTAVYASSSLSCSDYCITGRIFASVSDESPLTYLGCGSSNYWAVQSKDSSGIMDWTPGAPSVVTQTLVKTTQAAKSTSTTPESTPTSTSTSTPGASPATTGPSSQTTTPVLPEPAKSSNNGAIIGGAVGGCAVAIGLIVLGVLLFLRRRKNNAQPPPPPAMGSPMAQQPYPAQFPPGDMRPNSYMPPNSPPPPWDAAHGPPPQGGYFAPGQKPPGQPYQYEAVPSNAPGEHPPHLYPQGVAEVQGVPTPHAVELHGASMQHP